MVLTVAVMPQLASSQVKQVFKIMDFESGKPVAGATTMLCDQKLTTDARGIAVANLPADMKGAYLPLQDWILPGYFFTSVPESLYQDFQSSDTIKLYAISKENWRGERYQMFEKLYRRMYDSLTLSVARVVRDSLDKYMEQSGANAERLVQSTFHNEHFVHDYYQDASSITRYSMLPYDPKVYGEALDLLAVADINGAMAVAKKHIRLDDNSAENLRWIQLYATLRDLTAADKGDEPYSDYAKPLYDNQFTPYSTVAYIRCLNQDRLYDRADSVCAVERDKNRNPRFRDAFIPYFVRYFEEQDEGKLKANVEKALNIALENYEKYPISTMLSDLIWQYRVNYYAYAFMNDSVSASRTIDSSLACSYRYIQDPNLDQFGQNQYLIDYSYNILDVVQNNPDFYPEKSAFRLRNEIYRAARENYENDTANLFLKLQLAECAVDWLHYFDEDEFGEADSFFDKLEVLRQLNDLETRLVAVFPDMFAVQNVQVAVELLTNTILASEDNARQHDAFRRYANSFDLVDACFPKLFIEKYLRFNRALENYFTINQLYGLTDDLTVFSDRLISIREDNDPQKILTAKAEQANLMAESLYEGEAYEEAVGYYMQANEFYQKALPNDEQLWIPYLRNYLQMGDAHLYQNQFDKAVMTYQKILDYESQIPASMLPQYTTMKGNVNYYIGDVYKATGDMKHAEKEYKAAEKWFKKAAAMGDTMAYQSLGEMYMGKAVVAANQEDMKKCKQLLETSVGYYEKCTMNRPLIRYERAKTTLGLLYERDGEADKYYATQKDLVDFYRKFMDEDEDYAAGLVQSAEEMLNSGMITNEEALVYSKDIVDGILVLDYAGRDVELPYLRSLFNLAKVYTVNDSVERAIDLYRDCARISNYMFADTAMEIHKGNMSEIYQKLADCFEMMAEDIDTAHSENWYYRAVDTRDSLIELLKELNDDSDASLVYRTAVQYRKNGFVFYHLDMIPSSQDYFDKSNGLLMSLYNSEYKDDVEDDIIQNYFLKGVIYYENDNEEKALEYLRKAVSFGERITSGDVSPYYIETLDKLIGILKKDEAANAVEIAKLTKALKEQSKKLK